MIRRETMKNNFDYIGKINEMITEENIECEEFWDYCKCYICYIGRTIIKNNVWNREDVISAEFEGIMVALKRYDAQKGAFCSYARCWISFFITEDYYKSMGISRHYARIQRKVFETVNKLRLENKKITLEEIVDKTKISQKSILNAFSFPLVIYNSNMLN